MLPINFECTIERQSNKQCKKMLQPLQAIYCIGSDLKQQKSINWRIQKGKSVRRSDKAPLPRPVGIHAQTNRKHNAIIIAHPVGRWGIKTFLIKTETCKNVKPTVTCKNCSRVHITVHNLWQTLKLITILITSSYNVNSHHCSETKLLIRKGGWMEYICKLKGCKRIHR